LLAETEDVEVAAFCSKKEAFEAPVYGIQFHPEVTHTLHGKNIVKNFVTNIAGCRGDCPTVAAERWADWLGEWRKEP